MVCVGAGEREEAPVEPGGVWAGLAVSHLPPLCPGAHLPHPERWPGCAGESNQLPPLPRGLHGPGGLLRWEGGRRAGPPVPLPRDAGLLRGGAPAGRYKNSTAVGADASAAHAAGWRDTADGQSTLAHCRALSGTYLPNLLEGGGGF